MTDEYRVVTTRTEEGKYLTEAFLNGRNFSGEKIYSFPPHLKVLFFDFRAKLEIRMRNSPQIEKLEVIASGENLK